ncbi:spectrin alpha chain, non-erythrocytic 1-like [Thamnophis elegans]|uniref:spectrin alpha chain, non-erythrocytic 1-like n=1 Tax=Thamnophis elegans TaxID=35005 RepID=UPI001378C231|nr:spectrin alpha chain, non-erythrocytic 1-like [Thamnophis elegans]
MRMQHNLEQQIQASPTTNSIASFVATQEIVRLLWLLVFPFLWETSLNGSECLRLPTPSLANKINKFLHPRHFDKDKSGRLNHQEFKSCLRSLGYDLPMVEEGEPDPEFEAILDTVDPNRDGHVSLQEYMAFMISRETENVKSSEEIESAFRALSSEGKPYVTKEELYQNLSREQADYCISHMKPYMDSKGRELPSAYDYVEFTRSLFVN